MGAEGGFGKVWHRGAHAAQAELLVPQFPLPHAACCMLLLPSSGLWLKALGKLGRERCRRGGKTDEMRASQCCMLRCPYASFASPWKRFKGVKGILGGGLFGSCGVFLGGYNSLQSIPWLWKVGQVGLLL